MDGSEIVHVVVAPPDTIESDLIMKVAAIINKDTYDTRLALAGDIPRIIAHCESVQIAESIAESLRDMGLVSILCKDSELRKPQQAFIAYSLEFDHDEVVFRDKNDRARRMVSKDVFLILKGRADSYAEAEEITTKTKINLPLTVLMGGIPIWRKVREKTSDPSLQSEWFLRLYEPKSSEPRVDILQKHMSYSFLGARMTYSSLANFNTAVADIRKIFPQALFNDRLAKHSGTSGPSSGVWNSLEINCRLIYLYHLALSGSSPSI